MKPACFEEIEILARHTSFIYDKIDAILEATKTNRMLVMEGRDLEFQRLVKLIDEKTNHILIGQEHNFPVPPELQRLVRSVMTSAMGIIADIDAVTNWMFQAETCFTKLSAIKNHLNIRDELVVSRRIYEIFVCYTRAGLAFHFLNAPLGLGWYCFRMACGNDERVKLATPQTYIDEMFAKVKLQPLRHLAAKTVGIHESLFSLANTVLGLFTQIFGTYSNFDWTLLSTEGTEYLDSESTLIHSSYIIFQNIYLFKTVLLFFGLMAPNFFSGSLAHENLVAAVLSESPEVRLSRTFTVKLSEVWHLGSSTYQKHVLSSIERDTEQKSAASHVSRISCLTCLIQDYLEKAAMDPDILGLYFEQILAVMSWGSYELMMCAESKKTRPCLGNLLLCMLRLFETVEDFEVLIQRTFIYTLWAVDIEYLNQAMQIFAKIGKYTDKQLVKLVNRFGHSLGVVNLEQFDQGVRYDFFPFFITHGRIVFHSFCKKVGDLTYITPLLEHLMTIIKHAGYIESPLQRILEVTDFGRLVCLNANLPPLLTHSSVNVEYLPSIFTYFRCIPATRSNVQVFDVVTKAVIDHMLSRLSESVSIASKNVTVGKQDDYDVTFEPSEYQFPSRDKMKTSYANEADGVLLVTRVVNAARRLPVAFVFGDQKREVLQSFKTKFGELIGNTIVNATVNPTIMSSVITAVFQVWQPVCQFCGIMITRRLLRAIMGNSHLAGDDGFFAQSKVFSGNEKLAPITGFLSHYMQTLEKFIGGEYKRARYEQLGHRFVGLPGCSIVPQDYFAREPMVKLVRDFGLRASIRVNVVLMGHAYDSLVQLLQLYESHRPTVLSLFDLVHKGGIVKKDPLQGDGFRTAGDALLKLGLTLTLRGMLLEVNQDVIDGTIPGLMNIVSHVSEGKKGSGASEDSAAFLEAIQPGLNDRYLIQRAKKIKSTADPQKFFFFLGLLFGNSDWNSLRFDSESDSFFPSLQVIPPAIEKIVALGPELFPTSDEATMNEALSSFFLGTFYVAETHRLRNRPLYLSLVVLMDHFPAIASKIHYGHMKDSFPFTVVRACYNELADPVVV